MFKPVDHPRGDKGGAEVDRQPGPAGFHRLAYRGINILFRAKAPEGTHIVIGLFIDHIHDLIDGQSPHQLTHRVYYRGAEQVVALKGTGRFFGVIFRGEEHRLGVHHLADFALGAVKQNGL